MSNAGPSDSRSARGSQFGSQRGSQRGSPPPDSRARSGSVKGSNPFVKGLGYDPAKMTQSKPKEMVYQRVDLPPEAYRTELKTPFAKRPGFNNTGKAINVSINQFPVLGFGTGNIYQYSFGFGVTDKPTLFKKLWESDEMQAALRPHMAKHEWLYDGRSLVWSTAKIDAIRVNVDLGKGSSRAGKDNNFTCVLKPATIIVLAKLDAYIKGQTDWDTHVLECINFLDHVLRQSPSERMVAIKRNFFHPDQESRRLDDLITAYKGIYSSIRLCHPISSTSSGLGINVDVCNTAFWNSGKELVALVHDYICMNRGDLRIRDVRDLAQALKPKYEPAKAKTWVYSDAFRLLRKLVKLQVNVWHRGMKEKPPKLMQIKGFTFNHEHKAEGATARTVSFVKDGQSITVADYYMRRYQVPLQYPDLPLVETARDGCIPMEFCKTVRFQRYNFKLDGNQTAAMIKFAVTRPAIRAQGIQKGVNQLDWNNDKYLKHFGIKVSPQMLKVPARLLPSPTVKFGTNSVNTQARPRWDMRDRKFLAPSKRGLAVWAWAVVDKCIDDLDVKKFIQNFTRVYKSHGGVVQNDVVKNIYEVTYATLPRDIGNMVADLNARTDNAPTTMIFFVVKDKQAARYERIKKNMDCKFAILSQVLQAGHIRKCNDQYMSNVGLKVNAKLGGTTCLAEGPSTSFPKPTMILGCDVSHAAPGGESASFAALTCSTDKQATKYAAAVQTNGYRVELLTTDNVQGLLPRLLAAFLNGCQCNFVDTVIYFRDGVSEGQFAGVLEQEVHNMKAVIQEKTGRPVKFVVIIATKRHHIRFFPDGASGNKDGNPNPGTLVDKGVTHPFHFDFFLCAHTAIQGTARPVHYTVLLNEAGIPVEWLQKMIYDHCYQYARATLPVSLHPAVYYAHLASNRARAHENPMFPSDPNAGKEIDPRNVPSPEFLKQMKGGTDEDYDRRSDARPLLELGTTAAHPRNRDFFATTMWYI